MTCELLHHFSMSLIQPCQLCELGFTFWMRMSLASLQLSLVQICQLCALGLHCLLLMSFASLQLITFATLPALRSRFVLLALDVICLTTAFHLSNSAISASLDCIHRYRCHLNRYGLSLVHLCQLCELGLSFSMWLSSASLQFDTCPPLPALGIWFA